MRLLRIDEVCIDCGLEKDLVIHFVEEEWVRPVDVIRMEFDEADIARIQLIQELRNIFGVNEEAVPIILHLVDQLNEIHLRARKLE